MLLIYSNIAVQLMGVNIVIYICQKNEDAVCLCEKDEMFETLEPCYVVKLVRF